MENLTNDQIQLILMLFQAQNAERDIEDFVPNFHSFKFGFFKYKKIKDLKLKKTALLAVDDDGDKWELFDWYCGQFNVGQIDEYSHFDKDEPFDIMKYISFEDKL